MKRTIPGPMVAVPWLIATVALAAPPDSGAAAATRPEVLPRDEEVTLALSAAPEHLRAGAGVYALEAEGFVQARSSSNGFTCIVNRDAPLADSWS